MKNVAKKMLMMISLCLILFGVCACGPDTTTKLTLNDDFSGTRNMQMFVSVSDAEEWFTTDVETVNAVVADNCPEELTYYMETSEEGYTFQFTLDFASLEEYANKMTSLTGSEQTVTVQTPDTVFSAGIYVSESCYTSDLLSWLPTLLVDYECIDSSNSGYVLNNSTTSLYYGDTEYTSWYNGKIDIDELDTVALNGVNILTTMEDDKLSRTLIVDIPGYSFDKKGEEIQAYLEARVPAGATYELTDGDYSNRLFKISVPACSVSDMENAMKTFCDSENVHISLTSEASKGNYGVEYKLHEELDLTAYISDDPNRVYSNYSIFTTENEVTATRTCDGETTDLYPYTDYTYPEYSLISSAYAISYTMDTDIKIVYEPKSAVVTTDIGADDVITQSVKIMFDQIKESDKQLVLETVAAAIPEKMTAAWSEEEENILVYSASGTASELNDIFGEMLSQFSMKYTKDSLIIKPFQEYNFKMEIDIKEMIGEYVWNFPTEYVVNFPGEIEKADFEASDASSEIKGKTDEKTYTVTNATNSIEIKAKGKALNILGIIILGAAALVVLIIIVVIISTVVKKNKKKKTENPNAPAQNYAYQPAQSAYGMPQPEAQQPAYGMPQPEVQQPAYGMPQPEAQQPTFEEPQSEAPVEESVSEKAVSQEPVVEAEVQNDSVESVEQSVTETEQVSEAQPRLCPNCGNEVAENAKFCMKCGTKLE